MEQHNTLFHSQSLEQKGGERERYTIERGEEVETGDDEVGEGKVVDLLVLVRRRQQMVHHLQVTDVPFPLEH